MHLRAEIQNRPLANIQQLQEHRETSDLRNSLALSDMYATTE